MPFPYLYLIFLAAGILALLVGALVDFEQADAHPLWRWFTRPYAFLESPWLGGGRRRYFIVIGIVFALLGAALLRAGLAG
jgi:hypothetical protein